MKIDYCSDLHLDWVFEDDVIFDEQCVEQIYNEIDNVLYKDEYGDVLVIAGDIAIGDSLYEDVYRMLDQWCKDHYKRAIVVLGNHDYWCSSLAGGRSKIAQWMPFCDVIDIVEDAEPIVIDDVAFIGTTMWTDVCNQEYGVSRFAIQRRMNDYRSVRINEQSFTPASVFDTIDVNNKAREAIFEAISSITDKKIVVITHHAPVMVTRYVPAEFLHDYHSNGLWPAYFNTGLEEMIGDSKVDLWIFGHIHEQGQFNVGNVKLIYNCKGYQGRESISDDFKINTIHL